MLPYSGLFLFGVKLSDIHKSQKGSLRKKGGGLVAGYVDPILNEIGSRIKEKRKERHITQQELADRADLPYSYMSEVESGKHNITCELLFRIAEGLGVSWGELQPHELDSYCSVPAEYIELIHLFQGLSENENKMMIKMVMAQLRSLKRQ